VADGSTALLEFAVGATLWPVQAVEWTFVLVRAMVIVPLVLFLQGALVLRALMPKRPIDFEFIVMSVGMSLSLTVVIGLVLHFLDAMTTLGWSVASGALCAGAVLWFRRSSGGASVLEFRLTAVLTTRATVVCACLVWTLVASSVALARYGAVNQRQFTYTDLWIQPSDGRSENVVTVGVRNREQRSENYVLEVMANGKLLARWPQFHLANDEQRVIQVPISMALDPDDSVEARLYRADAPQRLYRRVWLSNSATEQ
jgi:uncharacterized membrane protein